MWRNWWQVTQISVRQQYLANNNWIPVIVIGFPCRFSQPKFSDSASLGENFGEVAPQLPDICHPALSCEDEYIPVRQVVPLVINWEIPNFSVAGYQMPIKTNIIIGNRVTTQLVTLAICGNVAARWFDFIYPDHQPQPRFPPIVFKPCLKYTPGTIYGLGAVGVCAQAGMTNTKSVKSNNRTLKNQKFFTANSSALPMKYWWPVKCPWLLPKCPFESFFSGKCISMQPIQLQRR